MNPSKPDMAAIAMAGLLVAWGVSILMAILYRP